MPRKFSTVVFWFDGAFSDSLSSQIIELLNPALNSSEKLALLQKVRPLFELMAIGKLNPEAFCHKVVETCQLKADPSSISKRLIEAQEMNQAFFDIYRQISPEFDPRVIIDIPEVWFRQLVQRWNVEDRFPDGRLIFLEQSGLGQLIPDVFQYIPQAVGKKMKDCFVVDPMQMRAVAAHRIGLVSTAFVYPRRMRIDLALQGIWKTTEDVYHPAAGSRTKI